MDLSSKIVLISGPTASGKSAFAIKLAKKINGEIVNADSMQVYKELHTLTARPKIKNYQSIKHHLYGFLSVKKNFSAGNWLKLSKKKITEIQKKQKVPILVGGTGLYFKSLTDGLIKIPNVPIRIRKKIRLLNKKIGQKKFYKKLLELDKKIKNKIDPNDIQRSIRAYEVKYHTKKSLLDWYKNTKSIYDKDNFFKIYIDYPRDKLIERIYARSKKMIKEGAVSEVQKFLKLKVEKDKTATKAIGINEISDYLDQRADLNEIITKIAIKTRQYAKRQSTWSRGNMSDWTKVQPQSLNRFLKKI